ncbi:TonB-linked outer membrane protein, SusC/RagA family [bacterium A37T11]|nr:TonB-linked outer membrane protein, SusC/RagA family [bacterium A37T11]
MKERLLKGHLLSKFIKKIFQNAIKNCPFFIGLAEYGIMVFSYATRKPVSMTKKAFSNPCSIKNTLLVACIFILIGSGRGYGQSQPYQINGNVISASDGKPLEGATVKLKSGRVGMLTGNDGSFNFTTPINKGTLVVTFVGYQTQEVDFSSVSKLPIIIKLVGEGNELEEVEVSTGYQQIPKERATGSFVHIDSALFNRAVSTDVISRLKGIAPSLLFDERAGGTPKLSIRGRSTIFANADPLIVVDNFPYEGDLSNLNPNDVADVSILRDAAAASIWGVRAGNGVIVITTKKGRKNQPMRVSFNSNITLGTKPDLYYIPRLAAPGQLEVEQFLYDNKYYDASFADNVNFPVLPPSVEVMANPLLADAEKKTLLQAMEGRDIRRDMEKYLYQPQLNQQNALNIRGGGEKNQFYLSAGYDQNREPEVGNHSKRISLLANNTYLILPALELNTAVSLSQSSSQNNSIAGSLGSTSIYERFTDDNGNSQAVSYGLRMPFAAAAEASGRQNWLYIPSQEMQRQDHQNRATSNRVNSQLTYTIIKGLKTEFYYQYEQQHTDVHNLYNPDSYYVRDLVNRYTVDKNGQLYRNLPLGSILHRNEKLLEAHNGRLQAAYNKRQKHGEFNLLAGIEIREAKTNGFGSSLFGYDPENGTAISVNLDSMYTLYPSGLQKLSSLANQDVTGYLERFRSFYFNGSYELMERYCFSASGRMDQTNLFGVKANQRTVPLWSAGFKWEVEKENFYMLDWLPKLALRLTYGYNGNFGQNTSAYVTATYSINQYGQREARLGGLPNPELEAERSAVLNIGADLSIKNDRLSFRLDHYRRRGSNLISTGPIEPTTGRTAFSGNLAHMIGRGWDVELSSRNVVSAFSWSSSFFLSFSRDEVTEVFENTTRGYFFDASLLGFNLTPVIGKPLFGVYSYGWSGLDPQTGDPMGYLNGQSSKDYASIQNNVKSAKDLVYHGTAMPRFFGAIRNDFYFKGVSVSFNIGYKLDYYFRSASVNYTGLINGNGLKHPDYDLRWKKPGDEEFTQVPSFVYPANTARSNFYQNAAVLIEKGDHIRLQDIRLSYQWRKWRSYLYVNNLGILWRANKKGIDPDYNNNVVSGTTTFPAPRTFALGLQTTL